jgi:hypothetical protein
MRAARVKEGTLRIIIVEPDHSEYQDFIQNARSYFTAVLHSEIHNVLPVLYCLKVQQQSTGLSHCNIN